MRAIPFTPERADQWDDLVQRAPMGTFLHTRRFLSYHGDRFSDASVLIETDKGKVRGVLPAALDRDDPAHVVSHPGATYGGLVHDGGLNGDRALEALQTVASHYAGQGLEVLRYKPVPHIYHRVPSADDVWALAQLGAARVGADLSCAIDLSARAPRPERRARALARARRSGVSVSGDWALIPAFWSVLAGTLDRRHGARPVHTLEEIELLRSRFPGQIDALFGTIDGDVVGGAVLFGSPTVVHAQYTAASEHGLEVSALDAVLERAIELATAAGARYFDFGISPGPDRRGLAAGLYRYKAEFGGGGVIYEHYDYELSATRRNSE